MIPPIPAPRLRNPERKQQQVKTEAKIATPPSEIETQPKVSFATLFGLAGPGCGYGLCGAGSL